MSEYEYEAIRGLPGKLPEGESILWQGAPDWRALARRTFHVRALAAYFVFLMVLRGISTVMFEAASPIGAVASALTLLPYALAALGIFIGLAYWHSRTTVYTITDRRVVMRFGIAIQLAVNLPFAEIGGAALRVLADGRGDIPLSLTGTGRLAYLHMWPHVRPARFKNPEPMLRCVPDAAQVARLLTDAWAADAERRGVATRTERPPRPAPMQRAPLAAKASA